MLSGAERERIARGAEQAREDFEETGLASARQAHRSLMRLLEADAEERTPTPTQGDTP